MTYEERKKWLCEQCHQKTDCAYVNRNMEYKCLLVEKRMEGWEQGYEDAIDKAYRWLLGQMFELNDCEEIYVADGDASSIEEFMDNFKKAMEEQQ